MASATTPHRTRRRWIWSRCACLRLRLAKWHTWPRTPLSLTPRLLCQDIVVDYASTLAHKALAGAAGKGGRMQPEDLLYLLRKVLHKGCSTANDARPASVGPVARSTSTVLSNMRDLYSFRETKAPPI